MAYTKYSLTPANNTAAPPDGAPEGMLPSAVNDTMRDMMAQIRDVGDGIRDGTYTMTAPKITGGTITGSTINNSAIGGTTAAAGAFTTLSATGATTFSGATVVSGSLTSNTFSSSGATITGGTINSTAIGGTTAAVGKFTTLEATGVTTVQAGTVSDPAITTTGDTNTGIFFPAADTIAFTEGGAEAMRITSSGDVCIGTTTANAKLEVVGGQFRVANTSTAALCIISTDSTSTNGITIESSYYGGAGYGPMKFNAGGSERMRVASDGGIYLGTTTAEGATGITFSNASDSASYGKSMYMNSPYNGTRNAIIFAYNSSGVGAIVTGTSSTSYNTSSDYRLKENITPMTGALAKVTQLKPCTYTWKSTGKTSQGFIAHELQAVVPDCVTGEKDAVDEEGNPVHQGVDTSYLVATLTAAIQELKAVVDAQAAEIALLKSK
jgi:hypothetical protein